MRRPSRTARRALLAGVAAVSFLSLAGCGQKGPLTMPDTDTSDVVIREAGGAAAAKTPERREPGRKAPSVPAPTQTPSETAPRSSTPR